MSERDYRGVPKKKWCAVCNSFMGHEVRRSGEPLVYCRRCWDKAGFTVFALAGVVGLVLGLVARGVSSLL